MIFRGEGFLSSAIDVSVLCLFFNRPKQFRQVFEQVKKARPSKLFLYQDGPRNEKDMAGILECREIANQIDWECEVHTNYQERNFGCDPSGYLSQTWAFSLTDKCIIIEDDIVAGVDFFKFCKILLDRYESDPRVSMIAGINYEGVTKYCPYDYFFTSDVAIWGWATWKRVIEARDVKYSFLDERYNEVLVNQNIRVRNLRNFMPKFKQCKDADKQYFEFLTLSAQLLNSGLCIVPSKNMIRNIGMIGESTHFNSASFKSLPKSLQRLATQKIYEIGGEINHPRYVIEDYSYNARINVLLARNSAIRKLCQSVSTLCKRIRYGEFGAIIKSIIKRL